MGNRTDRKANHNNAAVIANTRAGRRLIVDMVRAAQAGAIMRLLPPHEAVAEVLISEARKAGYASAHGGGVPNSYGYRAESTAVIVARLDRRRYVVVVGRGRAPSGPRGKVGPSPRSQLGCPWGSEHGRAARLVAWAADLAGRHPDGLMAAARADRGTSRATRWAEHLVDHDAEPDEIEHCGDQWIGPVGR